MAPQQPPAFDLLEQPGDRGWVIVCDFCPTIQHHDQASHRGALQTAAQRGWTYTRDGFNACPDCTKIGVR